MSKQKKNMTVLVRDTVVPMYTLPIGEDEVPETRTSDSDVFSQDDRSLPDLNYPKLLSTLQIEKEMNEVKKKMAPSPIEVHPYKVLNFAPHERLCEDLIDLNILPEMCSKEKVHINRQVIKRDPEPDFKSIHQFNLKPEYSFTKYALPPVPKPVQVCNSRQLYNKMKTLEADIGKW